MNKNVYINVNECECEQQPDIGGKHPGRKAPRIQMLFFLRILHIGWRLDS